MMGDVLEMTSGCKCCYLLDAVQRPRCSLIMGQGQDYNKVGAIERRDGLESLINSRGQIRTGGFSESRSQNTQAVVVTGICVWVTACYLNVESWTDLDNKVVREAVCFLCFEI